MIPIPNKICIFPFSFLVLYLSLFLYFSIFDEHKQRLMMVKETRKSFSLTQKWWMWYKERLLGCQNFLKHCKCLYMQLSDLKSNLIGHALVLWTSSHVKKISTKCPFCCKEL